MENTRMTLKASPRSEPPLRVLIVDDHPVIREGLAAYLLLQPGFGPCHQTASALEALDTLSATRFNVMLVDIHLPDMNGLDLIRRIKGDDSEARILVWSAKDGHLDAEGALQAGSSGVISKTAPPLEVAKALKKVASGRVFLSRPYSNQLLQRSVEGLLSAASPMKRLSDRELQIFDLIGQGKTTAQIAQQLSVSIKTIETHREHLKSKLGARTGTELALIAARSIFRREAVPPSPSQKTSEA